MKIPSIRGFFRGFSQLIDNRRSLRQIFYMATNDSMHESSVRAARRLISRGHGRSAISKLPVGADGEPLPWYTYPLLDFLDGIDTEHWIVIEFGAGQSTLYWAARARNVVSFENDLIWIDKLKPRLAPNARLEFAATSQDSANVLRNLHEEPDLIIVDGIERKQCAAQCLAKFGLKPIYLLDNSDWFLETSRIFRTAGLTEIRFTGFGPINDYAWSSSLWVSETSMFLLRKTKDSGKVPCGLPAGNTEAICNKTTWTYTLNSSDK